MPRQIAPLSTATVTSQTPLLRWVLPRDVDTVQVDICRDRACREAVTSFVAHGSSGAPPLALGPGVYFWRLRGLAGHARVGTATSPVWEFFVGARSAPVNTSWGSTLDVNGDGFADVVVGAANAKSLFPEGGGQLGGNNSGSAFVYLGAADGLSTTPIELPSPNPAYEGYGASVSSAGDVNGDGFDDLVVGAPADTVAGSGSGSAYLYLGGAEGLSMTPMTLANPAGVDPAFGRWIAGVGDVNGDGYADVVVAGSYLYLGGADGLSTAPVPVAVGFPVAGIGDVNGDGYADVAVGGGTVSPSIWAARTASRAGPPRSKRRRVRRPTVLRSRAPVT